MANLTLTQAIEHFVNGFATVRNFSRPYTAATLEPNVWLVSDPLVEARKSKLPPRTVELVTLDIPATRALEIAAGAGLERYYICAFVSEADRQADALAAHKALGCRLLRREPLFQLSLDAAALETKHELQIGRVVTQDDAERVAKAARSAQIRQDQLTTDDCVCRLYAAFDGDSPVGWVKSIRTTSNAAYVSNLFVVETYRRRGIGRALMSRMLEEDIRYGIEHSVLMASGAGSKLYPHLGYHQENVLMLLASPRKKTG